VVLGAPELRRLAKGDSVTVRLRPGTSEIEVKLSMIAQGQIASAKSSVDFANIYDVFFNGRPA